MTATLAGERPTRSPRTNPDGTRTVLARWTVTRTVPDDWPLVTASGPGRVLKLMIDLSRAQAVRAWQGFCEPEVSTPGASRDASYHGPVTSGMMKWHCDYNRDARHLQLHATDAST